MKRILLLGAAIGLATSSFAQDVLWGTTIGQTYYDLQSNSSTGNRIIKTSDGSMSATWIDHYTELTQANEPKGTIRGFGYNHFDGATGQWVYGPFGECEDENYGCASQYVGWPEMINIPGAAGDDEIVISHIPLKATKRSTIGSGTWSSTYELGIDTVFDFAANVEDHSGTWPRAVSSGNYIHMVACYAGATFATPILGSEGISNPIRYYRSSDAGQTWDLRNVVLPMDSTDIQRIGGDGYAIYANGSTVAITCGSGIDSDWLMFKSTDNGATWTKNVVIDNHNLDTSFLAINGHKGVITNSSNFDILIDDNDVVHVFAGMAMTDDSVFIYNDKDLFFSSGAGMLYWNDNTTTLDTIALPDYGYDGVDTNYSIAGTASYGISILGWPAASYDANGNLFLIYSAAVEGTEFINTANTPADTVSYFDLYLVYSTDNGASWGDINNPINIAEDIYGLVGSTPIIDDIFPSAVPVVGTDGVIDFLWQADWSTPGLALRDDNFPHPNNNVNYITHASIDMSKLLDNDPTNDTITPGREIIDGITEDVSSKINFSVVPNPAKNVAYISADASITSVSLVNIYGQVVRTESVNSTSTFSFNVADVAEGMYIVRVITSEGMATQKLNIIK